MSFADDFVAEAESWIGTLYRYGACHKGRGVDCARLPVAVCKEFGVIPEGYEVPPQHRDWILGKKEDVDVEAFIREILKFAYRIDKKERQKGDLITFNYAGVESHMGIIAENDSFIHAVAQRRVMKHPIKAFRTKIANVYRIKECLMSI